MIVFVALLGLAIGSFLSACIWRIPRHISIYKPARSFCPSCNTQLLWWENIPVLSWVFLRFKCSHCRAPISGRYPLVEALSCAAALACYLDPRLNLLSGVILYALCATLIVITFIDIDFKIIPNVISLPGIIIGLAVGVLSEFSDGLIVSPLSSGAIDSLIGMLAGGGFFYLIGEIYYYITKREGLGGGDVKLMAMSGALLGWESVAPTIFVGSLLGAIFGILTIAVRGGTRHLEIPFGPWLALGLVIYLFLDLPFFRF